MGLAGRSGSENDCELAGHADGPWGLARQGRNPGLAIGLRSLGLSLLICEAVQMKGVVRLNEKVPSLLLPTPHPLPIQSNTGERSAEPSTGLPKTPGAAPALICRDFLG